MVGPVLEDVFEGVLGRYGAGGHHLEGLGRLLAPIPGNLGVRGLQLLGLGAGGVVVVMEGLDVEVVGYAVLFALDYDSKVVGADAGGDAVILGDLDGLTNQVDLALGDEAVGVDAPEVDGFCAVIDKVLDLFGVGRHSGFDGGCRADDPLYLAAVTIAIPLGQGGYAGGVGG